MDMIDRVKRFIADNMLLENSSTVIVGVSGGADSTSLLKILITLGYRCIAVHCNFHLRGAESDRDQQFVTELCNSMGVQLITCSYDTDAYARQKGISIEMAARELRYADFERIRNEHDASAICIAHHRDDSVETMLLNLIRGTGLRGLTGIKPKNGYIVRPLLCLSRQEIEQWLKETGQPYVTDSTNLETDYTRNKIRLELLPLIRGINPSADASIESTALHLRQAYAFYSQAIEQAKQQVISESDGTLSINIEQLRQVPSIQALLFEILSPLGFNDAQITDIAASLNSQPGTVFASATHLIVKDRDALIVTPAKSATLSPIKLMAANGQAVTLPQGSTLSISSAPAGTSISASPCTATFDAALISEPLIIRPWSEGDWFIPFGMKGRKLISDFLTDSKVSAAARKSQLVVTHGDDIIWVLGMRTDNRYRVTANTRQQLILTLNTK